MLVQKNMNIGNELRTLMWMRLLYMLLLQNVV